MCICIYVISNMIGGKPLSHIQARQQNIEVIKVCKY
jgi:hypothetical protein